MNNIFTLSENDIEICNKKIGDLNKLAFGIILGYFKIYVNFPSSEKELSRELIIQISCELNISAIHIESFDWNGRTSKRFRQQIRDYLGYREPKDDDSKQFTSYLIDTILPHGSSGALLLEQTREYFKSHKIEAFKSKQLQRYINSAKNQFEQRLFRSINNSLSSKNRYLIDQVLTEIEKFQKMGLYPYPSLRMIFLEHALNT